MAVTNTKSTLLTLQQAQTGARPDRDVFGTHALVIPYEITQGVAAGDANSTLEVAKLPAGSRVIHTASRVIFSAFGASRVLSFGHRAYIDKDGTLVAEDLTDMGTALDVSSAGSAYLSSLTSAPMSKLFEGEVVMVFQCTGGTIPAGATVRGHLFCTRQ